MKNNQKDPTILLDALLSLVENDNAVKKLTNKELADSIRRIFGDHLDITSRKFSLIEEAADRLEGLREN